MHLYPKNRRYVIFPASKAVLTLSSLQEVARKSIAQDFTIWDYPEGDPILKKFAADPDIKVLTHSETLALMATKEWAPTEELTESGP